MHAFASSARVILQVGCECDNEFGDFIGGAPLRKGEGERKFDPVRAEREILVGQTLTLGARCGRPACGFYPGRRSRTHFRSYVSSGAAVATGFIQQGIPRKWQKYTCMRFYLLFTLVARRATSDTPGRCVRGIGVWRLLEKEPLDAFCNTQQQKDHCALGVSDLFKKWLLFRRVC
jgi:hypothetical protein